MKNLIVIMGKSGSGKDTIYKEILKQDKTLNPVVLYTTRPIRPGEKDDVDYHFITKEKFNKMEKNNEFSASMHYGRWYYGVEKDIGDKDNYIIVATPDEVVQLKNNYKDDNINIFIYLINNDEELRIIKLFEREEKKENPDYKEIGRRLKTDRFDFSVDNKAMNKIKDKIRIIFNDYHTSPDEIASEFLYNYSCKWR